MLKSFPFYQQLDSMDCGAACLRMIARYYGRFYSLERMRELTFIGKQGVSLLGISDAAEHIGFQSLAVKVDFEKLKNEVPFPCIAHWRQDHFVVIRKATNQYVWIADPAVGLFKLTKEEFIQNWASDSEDGQPVGILLILEPMPEFFEREGESTKKSGFSYLFSYFKRYKRLLSQLILGLILGSALQLIFPFLLKSLIDGGIQLVDLSFIKAVLIAYFVLFISQTIVELLRSFGLMHIGGRVNIHLISDFLIKLTKLPLSFFDSKMTGDLMQRIADHERVQQFISSTTLIGMLSTFNLIIFSVVLFIWKDSVFYVFAFGSVLQFLWIWLLLNWRRDLDYKKFDQSIDNQTHLYELINGMQEVKLHNAEKQKRWAWERIQARLFRTSMDVLKVDQFQRAGTIFLNETKNLVIIFLVAEAVVKSEMTLGMLVGVQYILGQLNGSVLRWVEFSRSSQEAKISLERMNEIHLKENEENPDEKVTILPNRGDIIFDQITFHYNGPSSPAVLKNLSFNIKSGKTTAIVGTSGSGKTTLIKLLLNFYRPSSGAIRLGDININAIQNRLWREKCGAVLQDGYIFNDTIARNIALGDDIIDKEKLLNAAKVASIQNFIESLPLGYNTKIGQEGLGLSQGQKQRLLIARVVYKNPEYIFFDEATNALDAFNEMIVVENLNTFFKDKTIVVVAHRLSTVMNADHIIVLGDGEIIEQGNHQQLIQLGGAYYQLIRNQLELGQ
jgi:ATP-binding cassette, subfamily B, bacterial